MIRHGDCGCRGKGWDDNVLWGRWATVRDGENKGSCCQSSVGSEEQQPGERGCRAGCAWLKCGSSTTQNNKPELHNNAFLLAFPGQTVAAWVQCSGVAAAPQAANRLSASLSGQNAHCYQQAPLYSRRRRPQRCNLLVVDRNAVVMPETAASCERAMRRRSRFEARGHRRPFASVLDDYLHPFVGCCSCLSYCSTCLSVAGRRCANITRLWRT